jgi:ribosomal-protein-alanine N-acetyltransferase
MGLRFSPEPFFDRVPAMSEAGTPEKAPSLSPRPATEDDIPQILELEARVQSAGWREDHFRAEFQKGYSHFIVLTDDETDSKIAGFIVFWTLQDEGQILNIAVDIPFRGLGLGKKMIQLAVNQAAKAGGNRVILDVRKSNLPAIQLYQGQGFIITRTHRNFYSNGEDAYQMVLDLTQKDPLDPRSIDF